MECRAKDPKETAETDQRSSMALSESETRNFTLSLSTQSFTSDSEEDPTFDFLEENCSGFSRLSIRKTSKSRVAKEKGEDTEGEPYVQEPFVPGLDEKDQKSYDIIQKVIEAGQAQKLKVNQCKIYLRKHGLRLTGTKDILIKRIQEYLEILNGEGEKKYPPSSFVVNCKGDACARDVILFEQNVYEMFNIAARCGNGPPRGTRVIAGRIVKESYGAAKQQHTFTIEVLWSKGEKPLLPLHPLLIKGRNLYRLKTMRQKWEDEGERQKILIEKHARGCVARSKREMRIQQREMRKMLKSIRVLEATELSRNEEETRKQKLNSVSITSKNMPNQPQQQAENMHHFSLAQWSPTASLKANSNFDRLHVQRQPLTGLNSNLLMVPSGVSTHGQYFKLKHSMSSGHPGSNNEEPENHYSLGSKNNVPERDAHQESMNLQAAKSLFQGHNQSSVQRNYSHRDISFNPSGNARQVQAHVGLKNLNAAEVLVPDLRPQNSRLCRYYVQGRCYYGQNCRYLHQC